MYIVDESIVDLKSIEKKIIDILELEKCESKDLGKKKFSYPILKKTVGNYVLLNFEVERIKIPLLKEKMKWFKEILRFLIVNLDNEKHFRHPKRKKTFSHDFKSSKDFKTGDKKVKNNISFKIKTTNS